MPSVNLRKFNKAIVAAELAGETTYKGSPCKFHKQHIDSDGTTVRDTVRRTCNRCENMKVKAWQERQSCTST